VTGLKGEGEKGRLHLRAYEVSVWNESPVPKKKKAKVEGLPGVGRLLFGWGQLYAKGRLPGRD